MTKRRIEKPSSIPYLLRVNKSDRILARQIDRAIVIVNQAPPIIHKGKAPRC